MLLGDKHGPLGPYNDNIALIAPNYVLYCLSIYSMILFICCVIALFCLQMN